MAVSPLLLAFLAAAVVLIVTPGLDTALVLRTAIAEGPKRAAAAAAGILTGCLVWAAVVAAGLGAVLAASEAAYAALKWAGIGYLVWIGFKLLLTPRDRFDATAAGGATGSARASYARGLFTNLLNPKIGIFFVSFLPQFVPEGLAAGPYIFLLGVLYVALTVVWFGLLVAVTRPIAAALRERAVVRTLDRVTGGVFLTFAAGLALQRN